MEMGLRFSELAALTWEKVNYAERTLTVDCQAPLDYERSEDDPQTFINNGRQAIDHMKAYENPRVLYLTDEVIEILHKMEEFDKSLYESPEKGIEKNARIFPEGNFRYHTYNDKIKQAAEDIGLERDDYRTHSLRATAATMLYRKCRDIKTVQYFLGHTTPEMTSKYIKQVEMVETLKKALETV